MQSVKVTSVMAGDDLVSGNAYTVTCNSGKSAGKYELTVTAQSGSGYSGTLKMPWKIVKGKTSFKVKKPKKIRAGKKAKIKVKNLSVGSSKPKFKVVSVTKGQKKYISVSKKGIVKVKKKCKSCKVKIQIKSATNKNRMMKKKTVKITVVKKK